MKKFTVIIFVFLALQACSHSSKGELSTDVIRFVESSGKIEIEIKGGEWQKIKSKGSANILSKDKSAIEQAMNVATLRAKANLVEFMNNDIKSSKTSDTALTSLKKDGDDKSNMTEISSTVLEKITAESRGIIKGAYVIERTVSEDQDYVSVIVLVDRKIVEASKGITKSLR